jgi:F-type H+-transporting ATPase subunit b
LGDNTVELNWTTFVLEVINFLVLVWILKHFLYKPVLDVIARRRAGIEKTLADAKTHHEEAEKLQQQYEGRLADWEQERQQARNKLAEEIEAERANKLTKLQAELEQQREKTRVAEARRQADAMRNIEETALEQGARFATRLLEQAAGPETETRLIELAIDELKHLPDDRVAALRNSFAQTEEVIMVVTAYPLADQQRQSLEQVLIKIASPDIPLRFEENSELVAGIRITIGAWILGANLQDELAGFRELAHDQ